MTATYSINGTKIDYDKLSNIEIKRKDYIEYMEMIKNSIINTNENNWQMEKIS